MSTPEVAAIPSLSPHGSGMAPLTSAERELWHAWKRAQEIVRTRIVEDVSAATGLSDPDIGILIRLDEASGVLRQNQLGALLGWDRSRLSHQVSRMQERRLLIRRPAGNGVEVSITDEGQAAIEAARPVHATAVRQHLLGSLSSDQLATLTDVLHVLAT